MVGQSSFVYFIAVLLAKRGTGSSLILVINIRLFAEFWSERILAEND